LASPNEKVMSKIEKQKRWPRAPKSSDTILVFFISLIEKEEKMEEKMIYFINQELLHTYIIECYINITHKNIKIKIKIKITDTDRADTTDSSYN